MQKWIAIAALTSSLVACGTSAPQQTEQQYVDAMAHEHGDDAPHATPMTEGHTLTGTAVEYATVDGKKITGYLAAPADATNAPAVVLIHEWWGLNDNIRTMADKLAAEGYRVLAVDLYAGTSAATPDEAMKTMQEAMAKPELLQDNLRQAIAHLEGLGAPKVGVMGWCFGGAWSLQTGLMAPDKIDAMVIYYGRVETDKTKLAALKMPILGIFAAEDKGIPLDGVKAFESALVDLGANAEIKIYPGVDHAFANPSGKNYSAEAAEDAWAKTVAFLGANLK